MCEIAELPKFTKQPLSQTSFVDKTLELKCQATGDPPPGISWTKDGKTVKYNNRYGCILKPNVWALYLSWACKAFSIKIETFRCYCKCFYIISIDFVVSMDHSPDFLDRDCFFKRDVSVLSLKTFIFLGANKFFMQYVQRQFYYLRLIYEFSIFEMFEGSVKLHCV